MNRLKLIKTTSENTDFVTLVSKLDAYLKHIDGDEHEFYHTHNSIENLNHAVVLYQNEIAVACGAFKPFNNDSVEIKRMYTNPEHRGQGLAGKVLVALEEWAQQLNYTTVVLETGKRMPDAIGFYKKSGFQETNNYGQYIGVDNSVCFKKQLL